MFRFRILSLLVVALGACSPKDQAQPRPDAAPLSESGRRALLEAAQAQKHSKLETARALLVRSVKAEPNAWQLRLALAQIEAATHRFSESLSEASQAEALGAPRKDVLFLRLGVATAWHDLGEVLRITTALRKLPSDVLTPRESDRVDRARIRALRETEKTGPALDVLRSGPLRRHPEDFGFRLMEASLTLDLARNEEAAGLLEELVRSHPEHPKLLRLQSLALNRLGQVDEVVTIQRRLRRQFPKDPVAALELAQALNRTSHPTHLQEALSLLKEASGDGRTRLAAARLEPSLLRRLGRKSEAKTADRRLAALRQKESEDSDSIRRLLAERKVHPDDPSVPARLTRAWRARGNRTAALRAARDRVRMTPTDAKARRELSRVLLAAGRAEEAWWEIRRTAELAPTDATTHLITAWAAIKTHRWEAAREALTQAQAKDGPTKEIRRIEQILHAHDQDRRQRR